MFHFRTYQFCIKQLLATSRESIRPTSRITPSFVWTCQLYCRNGVHSVTQREQSAERKGREGPAAHVAKKEHEHGSVLLQFVERKDQPGQLTVGAKGKPANSAPSLQMASRLNSRAGGKRLHIRTGHPGRLCRHWVPVLDCGK